MPTLTSYFEKSANQTQKEKLELLDVNLTMLDYKFTTSNDNLYLYDNKDQTVMSIYRQTQTRITTLYTEETMHKINEKTETTCAITDHINHKAYQYMPEHQTINIIIRILNKILKGDTYYVTNFIF